MKKEEIYKEIDVAFLIWDQIKQFDYQCWHRILSVVEQLRNEQARLNDISAKESYALGRPVAVKKK